MSISGSDRQAAHYNRIIADYDRHYYDRQSLAYRRTFILDPLIGDLDLGGARVADLASGSGHTSLYLQSRFPGIAVEGFDISPEAVQRYQAVTGRPAIVQDLTKPMAAEPRFDAAIIMGGLHHCVSDMPTVLRNIAGLLRPGGRLLMFEPNADYFLEFARKLWYRADHYFDSGTENALSHARLLADAKGAFRCERLRYFGGPAFFLIYNSLVLRVPQGLKTVITPPLILSEHLYNLLPGRWPFASFTALWVKS